MAQAFPYHVKRPVTAVWGALNNPYRLRYFLGRVVLYAILIAGAVLVTIPFIWLVSSSLKPQAQLVAFPPIWIPKPILWENYPKALTALPFGRFILNTVIIATGATLGSLVSSSLGAFAFARPALALPGCCLFCALADNHASGADYDDSPICSLFQVGMGKHISAAHCACLVCQSFLCLPDASVFHGIAVRAGRRCPH